MHVAITTLLLLLATTLSSLLSRASGMKLPLPLLQIAFGVLIALSGHGLQLEPDVFMLLFIPPLLFADAYVIPLRELRRLKGIVLALAIGLVLFSTLACGWFIHWLQPGVPLAAGFALAAVLSPTDAVAVGSLLEGGGAPRRMMHILSGEALLNDATGLVCFRFAVAAAMAGGFSAPRAGLAFLAMSAGGIAAGAALAWIALRGTAWLMRRNLDDPPAHVTLIVLLPFAAYLAAERLHASGILAAVAAGLMVNRFGTASLNSRLRMSHGEVWPMIGFVFNGIIFLLLGVQLPGIVEHAVALSRQLALPLWRLPATIVLITVALTLLRLLWIRSMLVVRLARQHLRGEVAPVPQFRLSVALAVAGVRGAITLAAVLSLPVPSGGTPGSPIDVGAAPGFPYRDLLVTEAAGVIICSLLLAALLLPLLLRHARAPAADPLPREIEDARVTLAQAAIAAVEQYRDRAPADDEEAAGIADAILGEQHERLARLEQAPERDGGLDRDSVLRRHRRSSALRLRALRSRRDALQGLWHSQAINNEALHEIQRELDHEEAMLLDEARLVARA
ncbi:Na+/H+ antiporter [Lichenicoccus sp.]|uniref:Na+/H+ antiporter n=1 Tax=Lichenicoccus sp. TaxID=2781899 RepID=UPI003D148EE3